MPGGSSQMAVAQRAPEPSGAARSRARNLEAHPMNTALEELVMLLLQNPSPRKLDRNAPTTIRPRFRADHFAASSQPQGRSNTSIGGEPDRHRDFHSQGDISHHTHVESPAA